MTDKITDNATIDIVKSKYIAISGTEIDVSGIIWATEKCYVINYYVILMVDVIHI